MIIFSNNISARLKYTSDFIGKMIYGTGALLTTDPEIFRQYQGPKINYSDNPIVDDEFWIQPQGLLSEKNIKEQHVDCFQSEKYKAFFKSAGELGFDVFAASFYLLSRYEEYLPHEKDLYGRYSHTSSLAFREGFLQMPLVNVWMNNLGERLEKKFPSFRCVEKSFELLPTYDIDEAFAYQHKGIVRNAGGVLKDIFAGSTTALKTRFAVLVSNAKDPYDSFESMDQLHDRFRLKPKYFFLVPAQRGKFDKPVPASAPVMQELIRRHAARYKIGLHPSWQSGDKQGVIMEEKQVLENISKQSINSSRQHYIRFSLPATFRELAASGITEDYSMGYGSINGFRASVASPFYWYDLENDETTGLLLFPFCFMEANSYFEQKFTAEQALDELRFYYKTVKQVNAMMITIWHNTFLGSALSFKGWKEIYQQFLEEICS